MRRLALIALVLAVAGLVWFLVGDDPSIERGPAPAARSNATESAVESSPLAAVDGETRVDVTVEEKAVAPVVEAELGATAKSADAWFRVVDPSAVPLAGVGFPFRDERVLTSDENGVVAADLERMALWDGLLSNHVVLAKGQARLPGREREWIAVVAPAQAVLVRVVDAAGAAVLEADVSCTDNRFLAQFPVPIDIDTSFKSHAALRHDADGATHRFAALRSDEPLRIIAREGDRRGSIDVESLGTAPIVITLVPLPNDDTTRLTLRGTVFAAPGVPAVGAEVLVGHSTRTVETDAAGHFELEYTVRGQPYVTPEYEGSTEVGERLIARHAEFGLAYDDEFEAKLAENWPDEPPPFEIVLPGADGALRGRLVDARGQGLSGWNVGLLDPSPAGGGLSSDGLLEVREASIEDDGRFALTMVDARREYRLSFTHTKTHETFHAGPFAPGPVEHVVTLDDSVFVSDVRGTLRGLSGDPLPDVTLTLEVDTYLIEANGGFVSSSENFGATTTDSAGRFVFARVPRHGARIDLVSNSERRFEDRNLWLDPLQQPIEIVATRMVPIIVEVGSASKAMKFVALAAAGEEEQIWSFESGGSMSTSAIPTSTLDTSVRWVSEAVVELALTERDPVTRTHVVVVRVPLPRWSGSAAEPVRVEFVR